MILRAVARTDFGTTRGAWTQAVLQAAVEGAALEEAEFNRLSARLIGFGCSFTWCNPGIVMQAGALANWNCEAPPLRQVIRHFGAEGVLPQARLQLAAHSIVQMFRTVDSPFRQNAFVFAVLNQLASRQLVVALAAVLGRLFGVDVLSWQKADATIRTWLRGPLYIS